jgi:iron(III) transport system permease protein
LRKIYKILLIGCFTLLPLILLSNLGDISSAYFDIVIQQVKNTVVIIISVVGITTLLGVLTAWLFALYDFPLKKWLEIGLIMGMVFPSYVLAFFYSEVFNIFGQYALIGTMVVSTLPYVFMIVTMSLRSQSQQMIDSVLMFGKNIWWAKFKVLLPLIRPAIVLSMLLVIGDTFSEFGATYFYGVDTIITGVYEIWFGLYETEQGIRIAGWIFITTITLYYIVTILKGNSVKSSPEYANEIGSYRLKEEKFGKVGGYFITGFISVLVIITFVIPTFVMIGWVFESAMITNWSNIIIASINSSILATIISVLVVIISTLTLYLFKTNSHIISMWTNALYSTPGVVLAIAAILIVNETSTLLLPVLFLYVMVMKYLAMGVDSIGVSIQKIDRQYYYSAKTIGKDSEWYIFNVQIPMAMKGYLIAGILIWIDVIRELIIGLTIRPQWLDLLSVEIFRFMDLEMLYMSGPWILAMVMITFIPIYWIHVVMKDKFI